MSEGSSVLQTSASVADFGGPVAIRAMMSAPVVMMPPSNYGNASVVPWRRRSYL
jgi:hypothetical protein